jgi:uncharacterized protein
MLLVLLAAAVLAGAFAQRTTGIGFALVVAPACMLVLDADEALGTVVRLAIVADLAVLIADRTNIDWRSAGVYLAPAGIALPVAVLVTGAVPARALLAAAAVVTMAAAVLLLRGAPTGPRSPAGAGRGGEAAAGFAAGLMGVTTGMSGPPLALHATLSGRTMSANRATITVFFLVVDVGAALAHRRTAGAGVMAGLIAVIGVGALVGGWAATRVSDEALRRAIPPIVLVSACAALVRVVG